MFRLNRQHPLSQYEANRRKQIDMLRVQQGLNPFYQRATAKTCFLGGKRATDPPIDPLPVPPIHVAKNPTEMLRTPEGRKRRLKELDKVKNPVAVLRARERQGIAVSPEEWEIAKTLEKARKQIKSV